MNPLYPTFPKLHFKQSLPDRCGHCGATLELGQRHEIHLSDGTLAYSGCEACLRERLLGEPKLSHAARHALRQARQVITAPCHRQEIEAAVAAIDAALGG